MQVPSQLAGSSQNAGSPPRSSNIAEMDEEAQMAAAIKASLEQMVSSKDTEVFM